MRAIVNDRYGSAAALELRDIASPEAGDTEVLVRVRAASINAADWYLMAGLPYPLRLALGLRRPRRPVRGHDLAGKVEAVGSRVTALQPGDAVFGAGHGSFAEYVVVDAEKLAPKPDGISFEQAAAAPVAGLTALQALRDHAGVRPGQRVLITGAAGGVGSFAVQIAKAFGAAVTGVCSPTNVALVRSLGAERVIDASREDFTDDEGAYDHFLDLRAHRPLLRSLRVLGARGTYVLGGAPRGRWIGPLVPGAKVLLARPLVRRSLRSFVARMHRKDLVVLAELMASKSVVPAIDRTYPLSAVPEAMRYWETSHVGGKIVITVS